jgi:threonine synthase
MSQPSKAGVASKSDKASKAATTSRAATTSKAANPSKAKKPKTERFFVDSRTGDRIPAKIGTWRSGAGHTLLPEMPDFDAERIDPGERTIWRYRAMLPVDAEPVCLGEGGSPLMEASLVGMPVLIKLEIMQPSGSYKDRGSAVLATALSASKARSASMDSSGNAGASLASYLARINLPLQLFVPAGTAAAKLDQAAAFGASIDASAETREDAALLAQAASSSRQVYASHVYSPYFLAGQMTMAWEIWEDLDRSAPDVIVVPLGNGLLMLGLHLGFECLHKVGLIDQAPRLIGVQAAACAPLFGAFTRGAKDVARVPQRQTAARALQVASPPRGREVLAAVRKSGGTIINVSESEIQRGQALAANLGWYVEASAAVAVAGLVKLDKVIEAGQRVLIPLTGSGLKT